MFLNIKKTVTKLSPWRWVPTLYCMEGFPYSLVIFVSPIFLKSMGCDNSFIILLTSLLFLPWVLKPLWAPWIESFQNNHRWILRTQFLIVFLAALLALSLFFKTYVVLAMVLFLLLAMTSATQDIVVDGFYLLELSTTQRAAFFGVGNFSYQIGRFFALGLLVMLAGKLSHFFTIQAAWQMVFLISAGYVACMAMYHRHTLAAVSATPGRFKRDTGLHYKNLLQTISSIPHSLFIAGFIVIYNAAEAQLFKILPLFLLDHSTHGGLQLSVQAVGFTTGVLGISAMTAGVVVGGITVAYWASRLPLLFATLAVLIVNNSYYFLSIASHPSLFEISIFIALTQFFFGLSNTIFMTILMSLVRPHAHFMSLYALVTALMNLGMMFFSLVSSFFLSWLGYTHFFLWITVFQFCILSYVYYLLHRQIL